MYVKSNLQGCATLVTPFPRQIKRLSVIQKVAVNSANVFSALTGQSGSAGSSVSIYELNAACWLLTRKGDSLFGKIILARG